MKTRFIILICTLFLLASCKKSASVQIVNSITANVNGENESFSLKASAKEISETGMGNLLEISGTNNINDSIPENIFITVNTTGPIAQGTYTLLSNSVNGFDFATTFSYNQSYLIINPVANASLPNTITITYISNTIVQGTFNVTLSGSGVTSSVVNKIFTNGKFDLNLSK